MNDPAADIQPAAPEHRPSPPATITPMDMIDRALSSGAGADTLERLLALQERWEASQARKAFDAALAAAKAEMPVILKVNEVDFRSQKGRTHYRYEDLAGIARQIDPVLSAHGLSYRYQTDVDGGAVQVTCIVSHRDGHSERNSLAAGFDNSGNKNSIQAIGSTVTYLQRYALKAALGLAASADDDSRAAGPSNSEVITHEQAGEMEKLIESVGADRGAFLKYIGVADLVDLPASKFDAARRALEAKRRMTSKEIGNG